jgi:hypothetical protein
MAATKVRPNNDGEGYDLGETVRLTCEPLDDDGAAFEPSTISLTITLPDATTAGPYTYAGADVTKHTSYFVASDIVYRYLSTTTQEGWHTATWTCVSGGTGIQTQRFYVRA